MGLDPDPARLWPGGAPVPPGDDPARAAAFAVADHCRRVLDATAPACVAVKLQSASFERLGPDGLRALREVGDHARELGLLVVLDAKRGDIDVSAASYADAAFDGVETPWGHVPGAGADAVTVAPYMGRDSIRPFISAGRRIGGGVFVLVRTSNPGAADLQEHELGTGEPVWAHVARTVAALGDEFPGTGAAADVEGGGAARGDAAPASPERGPSDVGAVVGATAPERLVRLRELMPRTPFLLPGVGAQGGRVEDLAAAFAPGPGAALVTASRSVVGAAGDGHEDPAPAARRAAEALRTLAAAL